MERDIRTLRQEQLQLSRILTEGETARGTESEKREALPVLGRRNSSYQLGLSSCPFQFWCHICHTPSSPRTESLGTLLAALFSIIIIASPARRLGLRVLGVLLSTSVIQSPRSLVIFAGVIEYVPEDYRSGYVSVGSVPPIDSSIQGPGRHLSCTSSTMEDR